MRSTPLALLLALLLPACGASEDAAPPQVAGFTSGGAASPGATAARATAARESARVFLEAVTSGDEGRVEASLTRKARAAMASEDGFTFQPPEAAGFELGAARVDGAEASVPASMEVDGEDEPFDVLLREEEGAWRIHGVAMPFADTTWTISFEGEVDESNPLVQGIAEGLAEGLADEMSAAFDEAMSDWAAGGSADEIAAERERYEALVALTPEAFAASWSVARDAGGRRAADVLAELLEGTGYALEDGEHAKALARALDLELAGLSRVEAIERVAAELGLHPIWEDPMTGWGEVRPTLSFARGPRPAPVAFVGPFSVEATVVEHVPRTTGDLTLTVRGLGLPQAVLAANAEMAEVLAPGALRAAGGADLAAERGMTYWGTPTLAGSSFVYTLALELRGLVASVESLSAEGELVLRLPTEVDEVRFDGPGTGAAGRWRVACDALDAHSSFTVTGTGDLEALRIAFAPDGAGEEPLGVLSSSSSTWSGKLDASLDTPEPPAAVALKLQTVEERRLAFRLEGVPLPRHAEQPGRVVPLAFEGPEPLTVTFVEFADRSDPQFPEVRLSIANGANKAALDAQATFEYLDGAGALLKDFPHSLTGVFSFEGQTPLCDAGATVEQDVTAFFLPEETRSMRVRVDAVTFLDGTSWERE